MRRKKDDILPIEASILQAGLDLKRRGASDFHGFLIASEMREAEGARLLTAYGTLYKALERMEEQGWLKSYWEDPAIGARERRPQRRLYEVTAAGQAALATAPRPARRVKGEYKLRARGAEV